MDFLNPFQKRFMLFASMKTAKLSIGMQLVKIRIRVTLRPLTNHQSIAYLLVPCDWRPVQGVSCLKVN